MILTFEADVGEALLKATEADLQDEILTLSKAAKFIRRRIMERSYHFTGEFILGCEVVAVPQEQVALVSMVLEGPNIKEQSCKSTAHTKVTVSLSELLMFSTVKIAKATGSAPIHHMQAREIPLPIFIAMEIHACIRDKQLIDLFHEHGLCISYDR